MKIIETERIILRTWKEEDANEYYPINQDLKVLEFLRGPLTMEQVREFINSMNRQFKQIGYTLWAAEEKSSTKLLGFIGISPLQWQAPFPSYSPCVEIAWRLGSEYWGVGYATEGARAVLEYGFRHGALKEMVAFTVQDNVRSIRVMEKIGMQRDLNGDFLHPKLSKDHRLSKHILYRKLA